MDPRKWAWNRVAPEPFHLARSHDNTICYGCQHFLLNKCNKYVNTRNFPQFIAILIPMFALRQMNFAGNPPKLFQKAAGDYYNLVIFVTISPSATPQRGLDAPCAPYIKGSRRPQSPPSRPAEAHFCPKLGAKSPLHPKIAPFLTTQLRKKVPPHSPRPFKNPAPRRNFAPFSRGASQGSFPGSLAITNF